MRRRENLEELYFKKQTNTMSNDSAQACLQTTVISKMHGHHAPQPSQWLRTVCAA